MADLKISALTSSATAPEDTDVFPTVESMGGTPATKRKAWSVLEAAIEHGKITNVGTHTHAQIDTYLTFMGASAYLNATLGTTVATTETLVHLDTETYDVGADFDITTNHTYTIPAAGYYEISAVCYFNICTTDKDYGCIIYIDGASVLEGWEMVSVANGYVTPSIHRVLHFNANQTIALYYYNGGATTVDLVGGAAGTRLTVVLINPD
jgi:hypothetical protein